MIKVLVVDDSSFMRNVITKLITSDPEVSVVGVAGDGREALAKMAECNPDVVTMDVIMPHPDGIWALKEIMSQNPVPVILVSSVANAASEIVEESYSLGVIDVVQKPQNPEDMNKISIELITKIKAAAKIDKIRLLEQLLPSGKVSVLDKELGQKAYSVLVIGSSAGGPIALDEILPKIPKTFSAGIIVAQHMPHEFLVSYVGHFAKKCAFPIKIAEDGDVVLQGRILFSPGDSTLALVKTKKGAVVLITNPDVRINPDIDTVFKACAEVFGNKTTCVVLSGMGRYGVDGARAVKLAGGTVVSEDISTATVYGMPQAVASEGLSDYVVPSYQIAAAIEDISLGRKPERISTDDILVKGIVFRACMKYLKDTFGDESIEQAIKDMPDESQRKIRDGFITNVFYSGKLYNEFCGRIVELFEKKNAKILEEIGLIEARTVIEIYRRSLFAKVDSLENLINFSSKLLNAIFVGISGEVDELDSAGRKGSFILRSQKNSTEICSRIVKERTVGWIKGLFADLLNISGVTINWDDIKDEKGCCVKFKVSW